MPQATGSHLESIRAALVSTTAIFVVMTVVAFVLAAMGIDLSFLSYILLAGLIGLVITFIVLLFVHVSKTIAKVVLMIGMVLFSVYIAFDTNIILQPGRTYGDYLGCSNRIVS